MMLGKHGGRGRVQRLLSKSGYGKSAGGKAAEGANSELHKDIASHLVSAERELHASGGAAKKRLDRKPRASGGRTKDFHPGGEKGKLHREIGVPVGKKIPAKKLEAAAHSKNPEIRRDAIRAKTMKKWNH